MSYLRKTSHTLLIFTFALILVSCGDKDALTSRNVFEYGDNLEDAISDFETSRTSVSGTIEESTSSIAKTLSTATPNIRKVSKEWEDDWQDAKNEFLDLEKSFSIVGKTSKQYFDKLTQIQDAILNTKLQNSEKIKNKKIKASWTKAYSSASKSIKQLSTIIKDGDDFHKVLLGASLREKLVQNIDELKKISKRASALLKNLKQLTIEGEKLVRKNG